MAQNVGDIEYIIKADTAQLLRADKQVSDVTDNMARGFNRTDKAADKTGKTLIRAANDASQAAKVMERLGNEIAILEEANKKGTRSAVILAAQLSATGSATKKQATEIGILAGKLYDLKTAQDQAANSSSGLKTGLTAIASAITISRVVEYGKAFLVIADDMTQLQARIARLSADANAAKETFRAITDISASTGASLTDVTKVWETLTSSLKEAGATNAQILNLTDTLQKIGRIGGSSTDEMANALRQFGQSVASGKVMAQEFNSILEQMPELARQIASGLGITMGELRQRMLDGKISAIDALNAIQDRSKAVNDEFSKLPRSLSQATGALETSFAKLVAAINDTTGATNVAVDVVDKLATYVDFLGDKSTSTADKLWSLAEVISKLNPGVIGSSITDALFSDGDEKKLSDYNDQVDRFVNASRKGYEEAKKADEARKKFKETKPQETNKKGVSPKQQANEAAEALLRQQSALNRLNTGYADGSLELAKYDAVVALGNKASAEQIAKAEQQAESIWKIQQATKAAAEEERKRTQAGQNFTGLQGQVSPVAAVDNTYAQQMAQLDEYVRLYPQRIAEAEAVRAGIEDQYHQKRMAAMWEEWQQQSEINNMLGAAIDSLQGGATSAITGLINGTQSLQESFANIGTTILNSVVGSLVQMGIEWVKSQLMGQAAAAASLASTMAQATAAASAWAPAAISASIATMGSAAAVGQTAYAGSLLAAKGMAVAGARYNGGPVDAGSMYRVGEKGKPEIFQANNGSQYMIPGDNGRVISNRDMQGGGGGSSFNPVMNLVINTTGGVGDEEISRLRKAWNNDMLKMMIDQSTRPGGLLQGRKK
ncbi:tape measure protein [Salmonella enterica]|nr:tape measure protein [Salmonella enterica]EJB9142796.1 tape measure protein [Salmonella enterica]EJB9345460.1 tape measure protein [Salmonella enterica]EJC0947124.1 tape measure protein [Salmonella enterica]EJX4202042.1 tape measure protein [Salmonella enterica]